MTKTNSIRKTKNKDKYNKKERPSLCVRLMELARQKDNDKDKYDMNDKKTMTKKRQLERQKDKDKFNKKEKKIMTKTNSVRKTKNNDKDKYNKRKTNPVCVLD